MTLRLLEVGRLELCFARALRWWIHDELTRVLVEQLEAVGTSRLDKFGGPFRARSATEVTHNARAS